MANVASSEWAQSPWRQSSEASLHVHVVLTLEYIIFLAFITERACALAVIVREMLDPGLEAALERKKKRERWGETRESFFYMEDMSYKVLALQQDVASESKNSTLNRHPQNTQSQRRNQ